jgi:hypothetical protein
MNFIFYNFRQNLYELVKVENPVLYPDELMQTCAIYSVAYQSSKDWRLAKEKTTFKIDVIMTLAMVALIAIEKSII